MPVRRLPPRRFNGRHHALLICLVAASVAGCALNEWVKVRDTPHNPLAGTLDLLSPAGPKPTQRTRQLVHRYNLDDQLGGDRAGLLVRLEEIQRREPNRENEYAMAEIAYVTAAQSEKTNRERAIEFYGTALIHAYRYLFDYASDAPLNAFDPQFRGASDLYNESLEGVLRLVRREGELRPGMSRSIQTSNHTCSFDVVMHSSGWHAEDIDRFEFVSDYQVKGLTNHYQTYGLGVPLIAVRRSHRRRTQRRDSTRPASAFR